MLLVHPFQRSFCVLFISLALIFYFVHVKKAGRQKTRLLSEENSSSLFDDLFANFSGFGNRSDASLRGIFDILKFLNSSFESENGLEESLGNHKSVERIYILGLFELTTKLGKQKVGESELMAAKMAVRHVNALHILPGYKLVMLVNDTQCDPGVGIDRFFHAIYSKNTIMMLLGAGCSNVSEALAHVVPYWNIIQVSYGSKSPTLSDRRKFPLFFRTVAPDSTHNIAKTHFIRHHSWHVVAAFSQSENKYLLPVNDLITELEKENVSCISTVTFSLDNYREQLSVLKAHDLGMYGNEYVWILENHDTIWWKQTVRDCNLLELQEAVEGVIMVRDYEVRYYNEEFLDKMKTEDVSEYYGAIKASKYAKQSYDAIWTMALTLGASNVDYLNDFNYARNDVACTFFDTMRRMEFVGLSGPIKFKGADRIGDFAVSQIQGRKIADVALYDSIADKLKFNCKFCKKVLWKYGQVPIAQRILRTTLVTIPKILFYMIAGISGVGISGSFVFLYFNLKFRQLKTVKLSSPNLNNITVIGCILVYLSAILFGFHNVYIDTKAYFDEICLARIYLLSGGFSLTFGSMFAKSYRVHRLFTYTTTSIVKNKLLKDQQLIGLILIPLFIDTLIIGLWIAVDPMKINLHDLVLENSVEDPRIVYQPQVELCQCHNTIGWHIALFGYKTIILIMGIYMAWKTRNVKVPALNDSQYIGICVYSAVFSTVIVIVFSFVTEYFILSYLAKTTSILASTTITLTLMFLPKLKSMFGKADTELSVMESMGLKIQYNTRRFISEDPKELLSRLEIQNKVYKCELESLDKEIVRLERLLRNSNSSSNKSSVNVQIFPEIHFLNVPRASWPTWQNQSIKTFSSENKLNKVKNMEKTNFFGKLKKFFGSLASLQYSYNNLDEKDMSFCADKIKPRSNPEIFDQILMSCSKNLGKMQSESCIRN